MAEMHNVDGGQAVPKSEHASRTRTGWSIPSTWLTIGSALVGVLVVVVVLGIIESPDVSPTDPKSAWTVKSTWNLLKTGALRLMTTAMWPLAFAITPALLVLQQVLYLHRYEKLGKQVEAVKTEGWKQAETAKFVVQEATQSDWSKAAVNRDYTMAICLNFIGSCLFAGLICTAGEVPQVPLLESWQQGILYGATGAYVYVLTMLGSRTFQNDISPGIATWCGVQLLLGPLVGGIANAVITESMQLTNFTQNAIFFIAGMAPRELVNVMQDSVRKLWQTAPTPAAVSRLRPLDLIHGITPEIEERFHEEGIDDVQGLAMANPVRLIRNLPYEYRQILSWMDEALLIHFLGDVAKVEKLKPFGISGAIDLAYYQTMFDKPQTDEEIRNRAPVQRDEALRNDRLSKLAAALEIPQSLFDDLVRRLYEDGQVSTVWVMYQAEPVSGPASPENDAD